MKTSFWLKHNHEPMYKITGGRLCKTTLACISRMFSAADTTAQSKALLAAHILGCLQQRSLRLHLHTHVCITYFKTTYQPIVAHPSSGGARTKRGTVVSQTLSRRAFIL